MSVLAKDRTQAREELLSQELLPSLAGSGRLRYETRIVTSELLSETAEGSPTTSVTAMSMPLLGFVLLAGGLTVAVPRARPAVTSYSTLVSGRPAGLSSDIGEALQIGRLHWASSLRQRVDDYAGLSDNWDGEGAIPPSRQTLLTAKRVFETIVGFAVRSDIRSVPTSVPLPDGAIRFEWAVGNKELFLTIEEEAAEAQRWEPRDSIASARYAQLSSSQIEPELEWLRS